MIKNLQYLKYLKWLIKLEEWINGRLDEVFAIKDDEYCQSASFDAIATFLASVGQFDRAEKVINLITVDIIKQNAQDKYNELSIRNPFL